MSMRPGIIKQLGKSIIDVEELIFKSGPADSILLPLISTDPDPLMPVSEQKTRPAFIANSELWPIA
tara:strand:- start:5455 stop:5652 length:198 start_codon:yes stop_codon:yes gene_type:complete